MTTIGLNMPVVFTTDFLDALTITPAAPAARAVTTCRDHKMVSATISDLVSAEEDLTYQAHLGDLHPTHAMRLAAVSAELDRRWSTFG